MTLASMTLTNEGVQVAHPAEVHQRCRQEAAQPDVDDQAALDDLDHRPVTVPPSFMTFSIRPQARSY